MEFSDLPKSGMRKVVPLDSNLSLGEIFENGRNIKKKNLFYKIVFNDETVFPELIKKLPNEGLLSGKIIKKLTKKIKKRKKKINNNKSQYKCQRSIFSLMNNSKIENDLFSIDREKSNGFFENFNNKEKLQTLNSFNFEEKNSLSFMKINSNYNFNKKNSNTFNIENFNNFNNIINVNNFEIQKKNENQFLKQRNDFLEFKEIDSEEQNLENFNKNKTFSNNSKNSQKYEEGLKIFYDQIKTFN